MQLKPISILLADEDEDDRINFEDAFQHIKIETKVQTVSNGKELIDLLSNLNNPLPDILFLDLNMPYKTGLECLVEIKNMQHLKDLPIAIYSSSPSQQTIAETLEKGANAYIKKISNFQQLQKILAQAISLDWKYISYIHFNQKNLS